MLFFVNICSVAKLANSRNLVASTRKSRRKFHIIKQNKKLRNLVYSNLLFLFLVNSMSKVIYFVGVLELKAWYYF